MTDWVTQSAEKEVRDLIDQLHLKLTTIIHTNARARAHNQELIDEHYKDKQMAQMKADMEKAQNESRNGFPLTEKERHKAFEWQRQHDTNVHNNPKGYHGVSGGGFEWVFYPTGLGTTCDCICSSCKNKAIKEYGANYWEHLKEMGGVCAVIDWSEAF